MLLRFTHFEISIEYSFTCEFYPKFFGFTTIITFWHSVSLAMPLQILTDLIKAMKIQITNKQKKM